MDVNVLDLILWQENLSTFSCVAWLVVHVWGFCVQESATHWSRLLSRQTPLAPPSHNLPPASPIAKLLALFAALPLLFVIPPSSPCTCRLGMTRLAEPPVTWHARPGALASTPRSKPRMNHSSPWNDLIRVVCRHKRSSSSSATQTATTPPYFCPTGPSLSHGKTAHISAKMVFSPCSFYPHYSCYGMLTC